MFGIFKQFFHDPNKETIEIFEREIKIEYDSRFFLSLNVLSLTNTNLKNLMPLSVFTNVEILNLAKNRISNITPLEALKHLKILDLRFNQIKELPVWLHELDKPLYWSREDEEKEGIYLEGNPLNERTILRIKERPKSSPKEKPILVLEEPTKKIKKIKEIGMLTQLEPLNTQHLVIFLPQDNHSKIFDELDAFNTNLHINFSILEYDDSDTILNPKQQVLEKVRYIIVILKDRECSLHPHLWESIFKGYASSKLFLIIEGEVQNIQEKIKFFKTYSKLNTLLEVFNGYDNKSNQEIIKKIYRYVEASQEVRSLWKREWILLKEAIEKKEKEDITFEEFQVVADSFSISKEMREYIFDYLKRVGSIKSFG
jgi:hypothetical protein